MAQRMNGLSTLATGLAAATLILATPAAATSELPQGKLGTIERGDYVCELPGRADGLAGVVQPDAAFSIDSASRYSSPQGSGTYLRRGTVVSFTSGARQGESYTVVSPGFLRKLDNGQPGRLRCLHNGR
jgi:SpoU rRNA methylase family enzyme